IDARMGFSCAQPGGTQSITVRSTPGFNVAYSTTWPDGSTHTQRGPDQYPPGTGYGTGPVDASGVFTQTWTMPPTSPVGNAQTEVSVAGTDPNKPTFGHQVLTWRVALAC